MTKILTNEQNYFLEKALEKGANHAVIFDINDIEFDSRTFLKCRYGCAKYGHGHLCPSSDNFLRPWEYEPIFKRYKWGVIIHSTDGKIAQNVSYDLELEAFFRGHHLAFSLSNCALCTECLGFQQKPCANPVKTRPEFHSVGIDVYKTVHKFGLPLQVLKTADAKPDWYSAVFVE